MLSVRKPSTEALRAFVRAQSSLPFAYDAPGSSRSTPPRGYNVDRARALLGSGDSVMERARAAVRAWKMFDLGWLELCWPTPIEVGATVAVVSWAAGLWSANACRIVYVVDEPDRFGFAYGTLPDHIERGEERFMVERDPATSEIRYDLMAYSRPGHAVAWMGYPLVRALQARFRRDSCAAMRRAAAAIAV